MQTVFNTAAISLGLSVDLEPINAPLPHHKVLDLGPF